MGKITNTMFARENELFRKSCEAAGIEPTPRQASRWRNGKGKAIRFRSLANEKTSSN